MYGRETWEAQEGTIFENSICFVSVKREALVWLLRESDNIIISNWSEEKSPVTLWETTIAKRAIADLQNDYLAVGLYIIKKIHNAGSLNPYGYNNNNI